MRPYGHVKVAVVVQNLEFGFLLGLCALVRLLLGEIPGPARTLPAGIIQLSVHDRRMVRKTLRGMPALDRNLGSGKQENGDP